MAAKAPVLILGSQSPRRKSILKAFALPFKVKKSGFDESTVTFDGNPHHYVLEQSLRKAQALAAREQQLPILTADTTVYFNGKLYEKPEDEAAAFNTLATLSGNWHHILTGVTLYYKGKTVQGVEETRVLFHTLSNANINAYLKNVEWQDKAGGYAIQSLGALLIKRMEGTLDNAIGLPINIVSQLLKKVKINLWDYLKKS